MILPPSIPPADEICLLATTPFDSGQRALWHISRIGTLIDCSVSGSVGPGLQLVYAIPRSLIPSASVAEFGMFGDALSPTNRDSNHSMFPSTTLRYVQVTPSTRVIVQVGDKWVSFGGEFGELSRAMFA
jgi:hypothetical protein